MPNGVRPANGNWVISNELGNELGNKWSLALQFRRRLYGEDGEEKVESLDQVGTKLGLSRDQVEVLRLCRQEKPLVVMMNVVGRQNRTKFRDSLVKPLIEAGLLELTIPDKPRSRLQRYRTTEAGMAMVEKVERER